MPFLRSSSRPQPVECFFCLSPSILPPHADAPSPPDRKGKQRVAPVGTRWNWQCGRCGCWNIRDERGEMMSDLPAMHNSILNQQSYSLRARPSSSHLPSTSTSTSSTFCHSCLANQMLITNMLANYLPDDSDPTYASLSANLPAYVRSLHERYPPVCASCQPAVDAALKRADQRAQVEAWGSALRRGRAGSRGDVVGDGEMGHGMSSWDVLVWRIRGGLWMLGNVMSLGVSASAILGCSYPAGRAMSSAPLSWAEIKTAMLLFHCASILWIAWDPYWLGRMRRRDQRAVRGRGVWVRNMLAIMLLRIAISALYLYGGRGNEDAGRLVKVVLRGGIVLECFLLLQAFLGIRQPRPIALQLVRPVPLSSTSPANPRLTHTTPSMPSRPTPSHESHPVHPTQSQPSNPIFGHPSLHTPPTKRPALPDDSEPMDWEPSPAAAVSNGGWTRRPPPGWEDPNDSTGKVDDGMESWGEKDNWDGFGVGRQRMFGGGENGETGLEGLLAGWGIGAGPSGQVAPMEATSQHPQAIKGGGTGGVAKAVTAATLALLAGRLLGVAIIAASDRLPPSLAQIRGGTTFVAKTSTSMSLLETGSDLAGTYYAMLASASPGTATMRTAIIGLRLAHLSLPLLGLGRFELDPVSSWTVSALLDGVSLFVINRRTLCSRLRIRRHCCPTKMPTSNSSPTLSEWSFDNPSPPIVPPPVVLPPKPDPPKGAKVPTPDTRPPPKLTRYLPKEKGEAFIGPMMASLQGTIDLLRRECPSLSTVPPENITLHLRFDGDTMMKHSLKNVLFRVSAEAWPGAATAVLPLVYVEAKVKPPSPGSRILDELAARRQGPEGEKSQKKTWGDLDKEGALLGVHPCAEGKPLPISGPVVLNEQKGPKADVAKAAPNLERIGWELLGGR